MTERKKNRIINFIREKAGKLGHKEMAKALKIKKAYIIQKLAHEAKISLKIKNDQNTMQWFIKSNHKKMTANDIAIALKKPVNRIYDLGRKLRIEFKSENENPFEELVICDENGFFNEKAHDTWLI